MKAAVTAALFAVLVSASAATGSLEGGSDDRGGDVPAQISWADAKHRYGWVSSASPARRFCSRDGNVLCATDDGGKHWRPIFRGGSYVFGYLRWSKTAGVVSAGGYSHFELWTRDGGRHWWSTRAFSQGGVGELGLGFGPGPRFAVGRGVQRRRQLRYAYSPQWPYRVLGWFPTRLLKCAGTWERWSGEVAGPMNICGMGPVGGDGMSAQPVGPAARLAVIVVAESGDGIVKSNPAGIDCGAITLWNGLLHRGTACAALLGKGSTVELGAFVSVGSQQNVHWTGCPEVYLPNPAGQPWCKVTLGEDTHVTATFG